MMLNFFRAPEFWGLFAAGLALTWGAGYCIGTGRDFLKGLAVSVIMVAAALCAFIGYRHGVIAGVVTAITGVVISAMGSESQPDDLPVRAVVQDTGSDSPSGPESVKDAWLTS